MKEQAHNYVGVSGFMSRAEVDAALDAFPPIGRQLMVGVLASAKTIAGQTNKYPRRYPRAEDIAGIFSPSTRCLNLVHYATDEGQDPVRLVDGLTAAMLAGGPLCHGVQVNASWPSPVALYTFGARFPTARVVLQLGPGSMACMDGDPAGIIARLASEYRGAMTDVLVDMSAGTGALVDPDAVRQLIKKLRERWPWTVGVAGGLCAETLPAIGAALGNFEGVSIDAESRLRDDADGGGNLDLAKVSDYLSAAAACCQEWLARADE